ncbi:hypothetical protein K443DRAFT_128249 [Laccaria amethystina LaAM-08-1]|uniref:Uncharacterized protein n=1 Tax=Laccaria amethystina LaAM-08-1 TaxID=1095629 RepID=A0A0C9Y4B5_9AGAR|nr:hypothetical protein K443DRAFT_128249 [Laccaria amethystina LaAM-08-1]
MPSLRRTASSPSVRLAPYSYLSPQVARGHGHRRSSGSETSSRRVLADIEWWRVTDGQCDTNVDQESEDSTRDDQDNIAGAGTIALSTELGVEHHSTQIPWVLSIPMNSPEDIPTDEFSALSITPHTPTRRQFTAESSSSSLESSPASTSNALDAPRITLSDMDFGLFEGSHLPPAAQRSHRYSAPVLMRSYTFADCLSLQDEHTSHYADFNVSPLSSSPAFLN